MGVSAILRMEDWRRPSGGSCSPPWTAPSGANPRRRVLVARGSTGTGRCEVGLRYRALAVEVPGGLIWYRIGSEAERLPTRAALLSKKSLSCGGEPLRPASPGVSAVGPPPVPASVGKIYYSPGQIRARRGRAGALQDSGSPPSFNPDVVIWTGYRPRSPGASPVCARRRPAHLLWPAPQCDAARNPSGPALRSRYTDQHHGRKPVQPSWSASMSRLQPRLKPSSP